MEENTMIKFKQTQGKQQVIQLAYQPHKTILHYMEDIAELYDCSSDEIKFVFKGKILDFKENAEKCHIANGTVMVVINKTKKQPKKVLTSQQQVVPGAGMSTGLGQSMPIGVGGYQMINHPQYMSAISSAVDPDKIDEIMNDPQTEGMIEQMMQDPDTLRSIINQNPMMKNMMNQNPMMKHVLDNPALLKMFFNKQTLKKTKQYIKNGEIDVQSVAKNLNGAGSTQINPNFNNLGNQFSNFQNNQSLNGMSFMNPWLLNNTDQIKYKQQLRQLELMGFKDKQKNLKILKEVNGDIDSALQKLCSD